MEEVLIQLEQKRKEALKQTLVGWGILAVVWILLLMAFGMAGLVGGIFVFVAIEFLYLGKLKADFITEYKQILLKSELESFFDNVQFSSSEGFSEEEIENWGLLNTSDRFYSDDMIEADYRGCHFKRSDIKIQDVRRTGKTTTVVTIFEGPYMIFEFPKKFSKYTVVKEREFLDNGKPGNWLFGGMDVERVEMESKQFNDTFVVYTNDGQEAFYLLTPPLMEKMLEINELQEGRFFFGFIDNALHVAVNNGENAFEPSLFSEIDKSELAVLNHQIKPIQQLVDVLWLAKE